MIKLSIPLRKSSKARLSELILHQYASQSNCELKISILPYIIYNSNFNFEVTFTTVKVTYEMHNLIIVDCEECLVSTNVCHWTFITFSYVSKIIHSRQYLFHQFSAGEIMYIGNLFK